MSSVRNVLTWNLGADSTPQSGRVARFPGEIPHDEHALWCGSCAGRGAEKIARLVRSTQRLMIDAMQELIRDSFE